MTNSSTVIVPAPSAPASGAGTALDAALRDIKAPVEIPDYWIYLWIGLGVLAAILLGWLVWKYWLKRWLQPPPPTPVPAHLRAHKKLQQALALINEPKPFVTAVSDTLRIYLEERFDLHAPDRTTDEFLSELQATTTLDAEQKKRLGEFLNHCDLVKFARHEPTQEELLGLHRAAVTLVDETEPKPVVAGAQVAPPPSPVAAS